MELNPASLETRLLSVRRRDHCPLRLFPEPQPLPRTSPWSAPPLNPLVSSPLDFCRRDVAQAIWHLGVSQSRAKALFAGTIMSTILQLVMIILLGIQVRGRSGDYWNGGSWHRLCLSDVGGRQPGCPLLAFPPPRIHNLHPFSFDNRTSSRCRPFQTIRSTCAHTLSIA